MLTTRLLLPARHICHYIFFGHFSANEAPPAYIQKSGGVLPSFLNSDGTFYNAALSRDNWCHLKSASPTAGFWDHLPDRDMPCREDQYW